MFYLIEVPYNRPDSWDNIEDINTSELLGSCEYFSAGHARAILEELIVRINEDSIDTVNNELELREEYVPEESEKEASNEE